MLKELRDTIKFIDNIDFGKIIFTILKTDKEMQKAILDLNRIDQLFNRGIDSNGRLLSDIGGPYSPFTVTEGKKKSPFIIDLHDTGVFYASFDLMVTFTFIEITADPFKEDTNLFEEWGKDIVGLTQESKDKLRAMLAPKINAFIGAGI